MSVSGLSDDTPVYANMSLFIQNTGSVRHNDVHACPATVVIDMIQDSGWQILSWLGILQQQHLKTR